ERTLQRRAVEQTIANEQTEQRRLASALALASSDEQRGELKQQIATISGSESANVEKLAGILPYGVTASKKATQYPPSVLDWVEREKALVKWLAVSIFMLSFIPLVFGGKIYKVLERIMTVKIVLVLSYLMVLGLFYVSPGAWAEAFGGFIFLSRDYLGMVNDVPMFGEWQFRLFPTLAEGKSLDWPLLGAFAAVAGQGGLNNAQFSSYARDHGWGMGQKVGAIPSLVGGRDLMLPHTGKCFEPSASALVRWKEWLRVVGRDQWLIWFGGCILGMAIPSLISLDPAYRDTVAAVGGDAAAAATAYAISIKHGAIFWFLTLLCGFIVLAPNQISTTDGLVRRWTEVIWTGNQRMQHLPGSAVRYLYFGLLIAYGLWGILVLLWIGDSGMVIVKIGAVIMNFALGFSALHTLVVNLTLLPKPVRPGWPSCLGLIGCGVFFIAIAAVSVPGALREAGLGFIVDAVLPWVS
ncbi:MAG TPA: Nramp family divalent metal transporter, partial [Pirellulaceae bacterium]|nr:Nramp family divalent metal transporter [Pirellulaceae bacterium]